MKRSIETIKKTLLLILISLTFLIILESDLFNPLRNFASTIIPFFHGKRILFSNILIGILGSSIVLVFGELITYHHEKQKLHLDILKLYHEWNNNIFYITQTPPSNFKDLTHLATHLKEYSKQVDSTYNSYIPFFRAGTYFQLLRTLYKYTNTIVEYSESFISHTNKEAALLQNIKQLNFQKTSATDPNVIASIEQTISHLEALLNTLNVHDIMEDNLILEINNARKSLLDISTKADCLWLLNQLESLNQKDTKSEFDKTFMETQRRYRAFNRRLFFIKLKEFTPKALITRYKTKKIIKKYDNIKESHIKNK